MNRIRLLLLGAATLAAFVGCLDAAGTSVAVPKEVTASFQEVVRQVEERGKSPCTHLVLRKAPAPRYYKSEHRLVGTPKWVVRKTSHMTALYEAEMRFVLQSFQYPHSESEEEARNSPTPVRERNVEIKTKYHFRENVWVLEKRHRGLWPLDETPYVHAEYEWIKVIR